MAAREPDFYCSKLDIVRVKDSYYAGLVPKDLHAKICESPPRDFAKPLAIVFRVSGVYLVYSLHPPRHLGIRVHPFKTPTAYCDFISRLWLPLRFSSSGCVVFQVDPAWQRGQMRVV